MLRNISMDPRFLGNGSDYSAKVTNIVWEHRRTLMVRLTNYMISSKQCLTPQAKDNKELMKTYNALPDEEVIASETLTKILQTRRMKANQSQDFSSEPLSVAGMMSLHMTAWDWLSDTLKNTARDIDPCMRVIAVECSYVRTYRPCMLQDKYIGALCCLLEDTLTCGVKKIQTIDSRGQLTSMQTWLWWDGFMLSHSQESPAAILDRIKDSVIKEQQQQQDRLIMENNDREAIQKLVTYVVNMSCAISASPQAMPSADIINPLQELITTCTHCRPHGPPSLRVLEAHFCVR
ncbi:hypothetical protein BDR04DRAFT_1165174 [Suillus decipiens]|nr:hypothetical protein BDR04DRAFT_1165174 [Suillus decipiens]